MARQVQLVELLSGARELADAKGDSGEGFIEEPDLISWANQAVAFYHGLLVTAEPERYEAVDSITATGAASYDLPEDFLGDLAVEYVSGTERYDIPRMMLRERNDYGHAAGGEARGYRVANDQLHLLPPPSSGTYRLIYVTCAPVLVNEADTFDGVNGWEAMPMFDLALRIGIKEEATKQLAVDERNRIESEIRKQARRRSMANPKRIVDVGAKRMAPDWRYRRFRGGVY